MFTKSYNFYDAIYSFIDYQAESQLLIQLIQENKLSPGNSLLDVACGTGQHIVFLRKHYQVEGLDLQPEMLEIARQRNPDIVFHHADMIDFALHKRFDVIVSMFSSIGFVKTITNLRRCIVALAEHLQPGGVLIIEPWVLRGNFIDGYLGSVFIDQPDLKIARINSSHIVDGLSILQFHFLVGTKDSINHFTEQHELGLFSHEEYHSAFQDAGLITHFRKEGPKSQQLYNRGLYIGVKPL